MNLFTEQPSWYILFCLFIAGIISFILYYKNTKDHLERWASWLLGGIRFLAIFLLVFLLLEPFVKHITKTVENPNLIVAIDNSQSMLRWSDSAIVKNNLSEKLHKWKVDNDRYEIHDYTFDDDVIKGSLTTFQGEETDFSLLFEELETRFENRNNAGVLLISDGILNSGFNPLYSDRFKKIPIYSLAVGNEISQPDVIIQKVDYNQIAFSGNEFPVEVIVNANGLEGKTCQIHLVKNNKRLQSKSIELNSNKFSTTVEFRTTAQQKGLQHYQIQLDEIDGEATTLNNQSDFFIEVLENRQKILILANAPHPDVNALRSGLEQMTNYELEISYWEDFDKYDEMYDLVILHQLPFKNGMLTSYLATLHSRKTALLYVLGQQVDFHSFNNLQSFVDVNLKPGQYQNVRTVGNPLFQLFTLSDSQTDFIKNNPPLYVPYGDYNFLKSYDILSYQKVGGTTTNMPAIAFAQDREYKMGFIFGEGLWRWRISDFKNSNSFENFDSFIGKIIQYLMVHEDRSRFRVSCANRFDENQPIEFKAEFYNQTFELINDSEVSMQIENQEGEIYEFDFSRSDKSYLLDCGFLPSGQYTWKAELKTDREVFLKNGEFIILPVIKEMIASSANHEFLHQLAKQSGGGFYQLSQIDSLFKDLDNNENAVGKIHYQKQYRSLRDISGILIFILSLLAIEWFLRKYLGTT